MAKLIHVFATLALFILLAHTSIYRAVVENDEEDDVSNPQQALKMCCNELRQVDKMCVCPTLKRQLNKLDSKIRMDHNR
ncbi:LOW QUALITY PROTEIN: 2S seed storage protein 5 [Capsella rubella]|uniref:LOW QUALITY PROTEIN: 2S seed storage protein 5 n=1 Tax=Capsella rubella TaxID=81985 RepID=UPI000CD4C1EA|nr:LOW QUALITY PROTEIN: 2S seed storage protein 5 [Capsella rubella]